MAAEASLPITARLEASADSSCLSLCHCWVHCLIFKWRCPADLVTGLGWIDSTGTLPERMLSPSTTLASGSIISRRIVACCKQASNADVQCKQMHRNFSGLMWRLYVDNWAGGWGGGWWEHLLRQGACTVNPPQARNPILWGCSFKNYAVDLTVTERKTAGVGWGL